ncbi:MAG: ATPase domain-containing protein [Candidatus Woesearchaeota archaeon]
MGLIKTGVPGLDEVFGGGIREGSSVLITGTPGTGKTILALQFIYEGIKNKEPCLYITSEESAKDLRMYAKELGIDLEKYEDHLLQIYEQDLTSSKIISLEEPLNAIKRGGVKRIVLDSLTLFEYIYYESEVDFRKGVLDFIKHVKSMGATLMSISERVVQDIDNINFSAQDFLFEGLFHLMMIRKGSNYERAFHIYKMRGQKHSLKVFPITISDKGMQLHTDQIPFSLIEQDTMKGKSTEE